jgi:hypothetical protein
MMIVLDQGIDYKKILKKTHPFFPVLVSCILLLVPFVSHAAVLEFTAVPAAVRPHDTFEASFVLDTSQESINAVEGQIQFDPSQLQINEIRDGNSVVTFWVDRPAVSAPGVISFSGIIPGGYRGAAALIFSLVLEGLVEGPATLDIRQARVLLHDGKATPATTRLRPANFRITSKAEPQAIAALQDVDRPELFIPTVSQDQSIFSGAWFLSFATQDKGSGIAYYEVAESFLGLDPSGSLVSRLSWKQVESPYVLEHQGLHKYVYVKAVDKSGNIRIARLDPGKPLLGLMVIILILLGLIVFFLLYWKRYRRIRH